MVEQIVAMCRQLGAGEDRDALLRPLAAAAYEQMRLSLRAGVSETDCGSVFPLACAMTVMDTLQEMTGEDRVTSFTAGEVTIRREGTSPLARSARKLLAPWIADEGFCFLEVRG